MAKVMVDWKEQLREIIKEKQGIFESGSVLPMFREMSEQFQVPLGTVRTAFYRYKKEVGDVIATSSYTIGDVVDVRVKTIASYGVICEGVDDEFTGLIHISSVKDEFIEDLNRYFRVGDIIQAEIIHMEGERVGLSTINFTLHDYWEKPVKVYEKEFRFELKKEEKREDGMSEVVSYLESNFGRMSAEAHEKLRIMLQQHGMFKFSMELGKLTPKDYTLYILECIENNLRRHL